MRPGRPAIPGAIDALDGTARYRWPMGAHSFTLVPAAYLLMLRQSRESAQQPERTRVLLQLRRATGYMDGYWACGAAGHVEAGESVMQAVVREAAEEVGVDIALEDVHPLTVMHRSNDVGGAALEQRVDFFFTAQHWSGEPTAAEPEKNMGMRWFALDELPELVPPHERAVLDLLAGQLDGGRPVPAITTFGFAPGERVAAYGVARPH